MEHELKILIPEFQRIKAGVKTFVVYTDHDEIQFGDTVTLKEWSDEPINSTDSAPKGFTDSTPLQFKVGFIGVRSSNHLILSLLPLDIKPIKK